MISKKKHNKNLGYWQKWFYKKKVKEFTAKTEAQDAVITELRLKLEKAEHDATRYMYRNNQLAKENENFKADVEELLRVSVRIEGTRIDTCEDHIIRSRHLYAKALCEMLLEDLQKIERKYTE